MRSTARSRAAGTSGRSTRRLMARRCATTSVLPTWPRGNTPATDGNRCSTRSRWTSSTCTWPSGATSEEIPVKVTLHVWRQAGPREAGRLERYEATDISPDMSFLEMLDVVNEGLVGAGKLPIAFDHDCREGI